MSNESVLLQIKRIYSKEESVSFLIQELKQAKIEIGILISEISELKYKHNQEIAKLNLEIKKLGQVQTKNGKTKKQWFQDEMFVNVNLEIENLKKRNKDLKTENSILRDKYLSLIAQIAKEKIP